VKDRFGRFNERLEEVESLHRVARLEVGEGGKEMRAKLREEVGRMVVPTYAKFAARNEKVKGESKSKCGRLGRQVR
jgi:exocyst complex component 7